MGVGVDVSPGVGLGNVLGADDDASMDEGPLDLPQPTIGDLLILGNYKNEPIQWRILDVETDHALLISEYLLDCLPFNETKYDDKKGYITWENCTLRTWLNKDFYNEAFAEVQQECILETPLKDANTQDHIFLLSVDEANDKKYFSSPEARIATPTKYAEEKYAKEDERYCEGRWWLRSHNADGFRAAIVRLKGGIFNYGYTVHTHIGVRPAMWVDLTASVKPPTVEID